MTHSGIFVSTVKVSLQVCGESLCICDMPIYMKETVFFPFLIPINYFFPPLYLFLLLEIYSLIGSTFQPILSSFFFFFYFEGFLSFSQDLTFLPSGWNFEAIKVCHSNSKTQEWLRSRMGLNALPKDTSTVTVKSCLPKLLGRQLFHILSHNHSLRGPAP